MVSFPLLSSIILVPLIGAIIAFFIKGEEKSISKNLRELAVWTSLVELIFKKLEETHNDEDALPTFYEMMTGL